VWERREEWRIMEDRRGKVRKWTDVPLQWCLRKVYQQNLFDFFPDICLAANPQSGGALQDMSELSIFLEIVQHVNCLQSEQSTFIYISFFEYFARHFDILWRSASTAAKLTEAASPCR
jgi:hypothetical protein